MAGIVYLVGAGPGDRRLLTLKAKDCLEQADAVVYDRLADDGILGFAPQSAEFIYVGKASSNHAMPQKEINRLLASKAKEGKCVVRLKGGDPFVFGRGGEEALTLADEGIPFEIVPGISSAIAVPAYAGIPVTHRGLATSFAVVTGHEDPAKETSSLRWDKLATGTDTLVFLMGMANLPQITEQLMAHGRSGDTPAALIRWGTKPEQRTLLTTVARAAEDAMREKLLPPAIFLVGNVATLRERLRWFDCQKTHPLFGITVLVTRARTQASKLVSALENLGASCFEVPAIRLEPPSDSYASLDATIDRLSDYRWIIFTSANGVQTFFHRLMDKGKDARALASSRIAAIGSATSEALRSFGIRADLLPKEFRAEGVLDAFQEWNDREGKPAFSSGDKILLPRAQEARETLPEGLRRMGAQVDVAPAYKTVAACENGPELAEKLRNGSIGLVTFTSSSTVTNLIQALGSTEPLQQVPIAAIGPITAETCRTQGLEPVIMAKEYTIAGLVDAIRLHFAKNAGEPNCH